jgi:lysozyme
VILKATQGTGFVDPTFLERAAEARSASLLVSAYHFLDASSPAQQAAHFRSRRDGGAYRRAWYFRHA